VRRSCDIGNNWAEELRRLPGTTLLHGRRGAGQGVLRPDGGARGRAQDKAEADPCQAG
jgi:hypothetical protein